MHLTEATQTKIVSLRKDYPIVKPLTKYIPDIGISMSINTSAVNFCKGGCAYCFCALNTRKNTIPTIRRTSKNVRNMIPRVIEVVQPNAITIAEKIEVGYDNQTITDIIELRERIDPSIKIIVSTKFPNVYKKLDLPNTCLMVTLSNPRHKGMEPHVPSIEERINGVMEANKNTNYMEVGARVLISDVFDIYPLYEISKYIRNKISLLWVDFMRFGVNQYKKFSQRMNKYVNLNNYTCHKRYGYSLMECFMAETIATFMDINPTYDRLPSHFAQKCDKAGVPHTTYNRTSECYIRADRVKCVQHGCRPNSLVCSGVDKEGNICKNLLNMNAKQLKETKDMWRWVLKVKSFAYGIRKEKAPSKRLITILRILNSL